PAAPGRHTRDEGDGPLPAAIPAAVDGRPGRQRRRIPHERGSHEYGTTWVDLVAGLYGALAWLDCAAGGALRGAVPALGRARLPRRHGGLRGGHGAALLPDPRAGGLRLCQLRALWPHGALQRLLLAVRRGAAA